MDGKVSASAGELILIPKKIAKIQFSVAEASAFVYVTFPRQIGRINKFVESKTLYIFLS